MTAAASFAATGLEGIPAAETALSHIDGDAGRLILCGRDLADFVSAHGFESAAAAFWSAAEGGEPASARDVCDALGRARVAAFERFTNIASAFAPLTLSESLRVGLASLPEQRPGGPAAAAAHAPTWKPCIAVTAAVPVFIANVVRLRQGKPPVPPDARSAHVEDFLRMLTGETPDDERVKALRTYVVTVMDHGMNASTFTARIIASTRAGIVSVVVGAYSALTGPLHGGAPGPVLDMLDAIGSPQNAADWIESALRGGQRLMGFGHRIYRVRDPRTDVLKAALEALSPSGRKLKLARAVEVAALEALRRHKPDRKLETNVEFYTAMLLEALGVPRDAFTALFAMGRVVGWTAHALEQRRNGRLIRPASVYVGRIPGVSS